MENKFLQMLTLTRQTQFVYVEMNVHFTNNS